MTAWILKSEPTTYSWDDYPRVVFARGLTRLSSADARRVAGKKTADAHALVDALPDELVHRDDLALL